MYGRHAVTHSRTVHHIVVHERGIVKHLHRHGCSDRLVAHLAAELGGKQNECRTQLFAAFGTDIAEHLVEHDVLGTHGLLIQVLELTELLSNSLAYLGDCIH